MYSLGTPVRSSDEKSDIRSSVDITPPADTSHLPALCALNQDFEGVKRIAVVSPSEQKPLLTMDQFKPLVAQELASRKGKALRHTSALEADYEEMRAVRRSARIKKLKDEATIVHEYADRKMMSSRKIPPRIIS